MVGAAGIVASTINNRHQRRESRDSQHGTNDSSSYQPSHPHYNAHVARHGSRAAISPPSTVPGNNLNNSSNAYCYASSTPRAPNSTSNINLTSSKSTPPDGNKLEVELTPEKLSFAEQVKFYISLALGIVASLCVFALLFLIPLVVEPSISTLLADFDPAPAICVTVDYTSATGLSKCGLWASCREGCTSVPPVCHQIYVSYLRADSPHHLKQRDGSQRRRRIQNNTILDPHDWLDESRWDVSYTQLLVNAKGCGYPPRVKCDEFGDTYGLQGRTFPCYYSRSNPRLVVTDYSWEEAAQPLLLSLGLPTFLFSLSIGVLSAWYCPSCEERGKNKRPCRSRYTSAPTTDHPHPHAHPRSSSASRKRPTTTLENHQPTPIHPQPILQQPPRIKGQSQGQGQGQGQERSPSLATISSRDTTISSVNSMDEGWQSPPSPPPRANVNTRTLAALAHRNNHNNNNNNNNNNSNNPGGGGESGGARARKL